MGAVTGPVVDNSIKQICSTTISQLLSQYFANTLGKETDIVKLVMGLIQTESSFNVNAQGPALNPVNSSGAADYAYSSAVQAAIAKGGDVAYANVNQGVHAIGLMQCMGWNIVKGASKAGKQLIEQARPDLVSVLCVNPGESITAKLLGSANVSNQILSGLVVLEQKYKAVKQSGNQYTIGSGNNQFTYLSKMECALQGYIGLSKNDKGNGSSTSAYVATIYYGPNYQKANGSGGVAVSNPGSTSTGSITIASGNNQHPPGC